MIGPRVAFGMGRYGQRGGVLFLSGMGGFLVRVVASFERVTSVYREIRESNVWRWS